MANLTSLNFIVTCIYVILLLILGGIVFGSRRKQLISLIFSGLIIGAILWTAAILLSNVDIPRALFWTQLSFFGSTLLVYFVFLLSSYFPTSKSHGKVFQGTVLGCTLLLLGLSFSKGLVSGITIIPGGTGVTQGPLFPAYILLFLGYFACSIYNSTQQYRAGTVAEKEQLNFLYIGIFLSAVISILTNLVIPFVRQNDSLTSYGPYSLIFFLAFTAYAVIARHLFDVRLIVHKAILFTGLLTLTLATYGAAIVVLAAVFGQPRSLDLRFVIANTLACLAISIGYEPINHWLQNATDRYLFRQDWERQRLMRDIGHKLNDVIGLDEALETVMHGLTSIFALGHAATYVFQQGDKGQPVVKRVRQIGYPASAMLALDDRDFITVFFAERESILSVERLRETVRSEETYMRDKRDGELVRSHAIKSAVLRRLDSLETAIAIPLRIKGQAIGLIVLGAKISGDPFTDEDLTLVDLVATQIIASIEKSRLYESDQMKSEFVSIASHELLTPISAMEGYLSMILDEHIGTVDDKSRAYLDSVYSSAHRLSSLVKDMLAASRLEAGQMQINPTQLDLETLVDATLKNLRTAAKEKSLSLTIEQQEGLPPVIADAERLAQIITNLVGNSIKYTFSGGITVRTSYPNPEGMVNVEVIDTGVGMPKEQQDHLFEKFYRVYSIDTADVPGTGLGLYITKALVEKMGGIISVKSEPGIGSTFSFTLPVIPVE